jgi:hypothetical protein
MNHMDFLGTLTFDDYMNTSVKVLEWGPVSPAVRVSVGEKQIFSLPDTTVDSFGEKLFIQLKYNW